MRALDPTRTGTVNRDDVAIFYEVYENEGPTLVLVPPSPITHSRFYKGQIPYLARHFRVVTLDGRGNGRSGRPVGPERHTRAENVADIRAVLDASDTDTGVVVAHCHANWWALELALCDPERVSALIALDPGVPYLGVPHQHWIDAGATWDDVLVHPTGWQLFNRHVITNDLSRWVSFFFDAQLVESHSSKQYEDAVAWSLETTGEILADSEEAQEVSPPTQAEFEGQVAQLDIPVLVVHGDRDVCQHIEKGRELAASTDGELLVIEGGGHLTPVRHPVVVNRAIEEFVRRRLERV